MAALRDDPDAFAEQRERKRLGRNPEKRRAAEMRAEARRQDRFKDDAEYRQRRVKTKRASEERRKARRKSDPDYADGVRKNARRWYRRHRLRLLAQRRALADARREQVRAYRRRKYAEDPAKALARSRRWAGRNPEKIQALRRANDHRRRSAGPAFTAAEWHSLVAQYGGACAYCGATTALEADHRVPICRGGSNSIDNILPACRPCNRGKGAMTEDEFRVRRDGDIRSLAEPRTA